VSLGVAVDTPEGASVAKIRVVLADKNQEIVAITRRTLGEEFEVVSSVEDGKQAVEAVQILNPDVLIIDLSMPILNGLEAAKQLQMANCRAKVIFLTTYEGPDFLDAAFAAGASGYVTKARLSIDLIPALHEAILGHTFVSGSLPK
jgi:DNA-binding NarL/FixJ family response regulator